MKDHFDKKREMVAMLMDMLKHNAASEVSGTGDAAGHPHVADLTRTNALQQQTSDSSKMAEGGLAGTDMSVTDQASRLTEPVSNPSDSAQDETAVNALPGTIEDEPAELDALQTAHNSDMMDEDEDNNQSSFQAFLKRKK